jgi:HD-GYP domain-containing protein (c-di-GMP phosphodiesterase class II)
MVSERPYRGTISEGHVLSELEKETGRQFDAVVARTARTLIENGLLKIGMQTYAQQSTVSMRK